MLLIFSRYRGLLLSLIYNRSKLRASLLAHAKSSHSDISVPSPFKLTISYRAVKVKLFEQLFTRIIRRLYQM